jgi:hypothetical protein
MKPILFMKYVLLAYQRVSRSREREMSRVRSFGTFGASGEGPTALDEGALAPVALGAEAPDAVACMILSSGKYRRLEF